jgi:hypothetical protein
MKKLLGVVLAGCALGLSLGAREVAAGQGFTPPAALAGTYAITAHGSVFFCVQSTPPYLPAQCGSPGVLRFPLTVQDVGTVTQDEQGNACATLTETNSDHPVDPSPPFVIVFHQVSKATSYDPTTGEGDVSFTTYVGGQCTVGPFGGTGTTFDSTGALVANTGTAHFVASNNGARLDVVITSLTSPQGAIGDFSLSGTALRQ